MVRRWAQDVARIGAAERKCALESLATHGYEARLTGRRPGLVSRPVGRTEHKFKERPDGQGKV
jgi:hypothetical protein